MPTSLSQYGILALEIVVKEFMNVQCNTMYEQLLLEEIRSYLNNKESNLLSYTSKKAIDIIRLDYTDNYLMLHAIYIHLNKETPIIQSNYKRRIDALDEKCYKKSRNLNI